VPLPTQITYTASARFPTPSLSAQSVQSELRGMIDRSSQLANPSGIQVTYDGTVVMLRGQVRDEEEARTAEGIIRLTPGVKQVKNELKY
jgi:osmotically-inducible protein OsmY